MAARSIKAVVTVSSKRCEDVSVAVRSSLLPWYVRHARVLPWRRRRTPYRVWVSEVLLQQTRVAQAEEYYIRFLRKFPSLRALAASSTDEVLKAWEGLGYYARARNLHRLAREVTARSGGRFPRTLEGLRALPGVGPYTAAAVGSLALGLHAAVVDGNVRRVLSRVFALPQADEASLASLAQRLLVQGKAGLCNEAWMELGALVCMPQVPDCARCPLRGTCAAYSQGRPSSYPAKKARRRIPHKRVGAAVIRDGRGRYLIARRRESDMLGGLWEFPGGKQEPGESMEACIARELKEEMGLDISVGKRIAMVRHAYSHFTMELHAHEACVTGGKPQCLECSGFAWVAPDKFNGFAFSRADLKVIEHLCP